MASSSPGTIGRPAIGDKDSDRGMIHMGSFSMSRRRVNRLGTFPMASNSDDSLSAANMKRVSDSRLV